MHGWICKEIIKLLKTTIYVLTLIHYLVYLIKDCRFFCQDHQQENCLLLLNVTHRYTTLNSIKWSLFFCTFQYCVHGITCNSLTVYIRWKKEVPPSKVIILKSFIYKMLLKDFSLYWKFHGEIVNDNIRSQLHSSCSLHLICYFSFLFSGYFLLGEFPWNGKLLLVVESSLLCTFYQV